VFRVAIGGAPIQVPALVTAIAIPLKQTPTWKENGVAVGGSSSMVNLTTDTLCGIFTGAITDWSDNAFKAANGGLQLGNGPIKVIYRADGSGGTFVLTNTLVHQCAFTSHAVPVSWQTAPGNSSGAGSDFFFSNVSKAGLLPANFTFVPNGQTMENMIGNTAGSIGYDSPDFTLLVDAAGPKAVNLQTFASIGHAPVFLAPTAQNSARIVGSVKPPSSLPASCDAAHATGVAPFILSSDGICADSPLNWGLTFPAPISTKAYPIGGFSFIDTYTCFASVAVRDALAGTTVGHLGLLRWYFGSTADNSSQVLTDLNRNGFAEIPGSWVSGVKRLLTSAPATKIGIPGQAKTGCASVSGGA
jgi:phosphate transport system substrate-binding protein